MEKEKAFKLFLPPCLSGGQVPAVKPQTDTPAAVGLRQDSNKCPDDDDDNLPFVLMSTPNHGVITNSDAISQQGKLPSEADEEAESLCDSLNMTGDKWLNMKNVETANELYSKLYKEAEKIKWWKLSVESELKQKERKLQANRKTIEEQRKAIQELQLDNQKLSLKLEDEIGEKKDLLKENSASRHLCDLLKETCTQFTEKSTKYEHERDETKRLYADLNNNVERMTRAFQELRVQAENKRLEMSFKLKEAAEKVEKFETECKLEISMKEKQISVLTVQSDEKDHIIRDVKTQLQESKNKIADLVEEKRHEGEMLKESQISQELLREELEEAKISLQKKEVTQKSLETQLQSAMQALIQVTGEKEAQVEECEQTKAMHASVIKEFETSISKLKSLLQEEQNRLRKSEDEAELLATELRNKSAELEEMTQLKCDKEMQLEELSETVGKVEGLLVKMADLEATIENLHEREKEMKNVLQIREQEIHDLKVQLAATAEKEQDHLHQLAALNTDLEKEALKNEELTVHISQLLLEKEQIAQEKSDMATELEKLQESNEDNRKKEEYTKQLVENLEEANGQLRNELQSLKEKMAKKSEETKSKLDEREKNSKNLKKQVESKTKCIEELQQEVNKLQLEMENMSKQHKETVDTYLKDIETKNENENKLLEEVEKMRLLADEATIAQRETDLRCQHKITEMLALMEKHKHEYDKMVEEQDAELKLYKIKEQEHLSSKRSLETELSRLKSQLSALKEQLKAEIEEKKIQTYFPETPKPPLHLDSESLNVKRKKTPNGTRLKYNMMGKEKMPPLVAEENALGSPLLETYIIKTPPRHRLQSESTNLPSDQCARKKQKVLLQLDAQSDSSECSDLLSIISEEEMLKKLYKDYPQASQVYATIPEKKPPAASVKTSGSVLKLSTRRKMREAEWTAVSKIDRKRKIKEAEKLFT
ncbi:synaptonemal complex protein 1 isoform X2 [Melanerpes formicivorus]|uniref:synaptonemal complex protein 1 isoform X2 n=1 Tax=Melanerpes formicivorus TaxID=211600 RepID=UPI00358EF22D